MNMSLKETEKNKIKNWRKSINVLKNVKKAKKKKTEGNKQSCVIHEMELEVITET